MRGVLNLGMVIVVGVGVADLVIHAAGTTALFNGLGGLWKTSINGLLGSTTK